MASSTRVKKGVNGGRAMLVASCVSCACDGCRAAYGRRGEAMELGRVVLVVPPGGSFPVGSDCEVDGDIVCLGGLVGRLMARLEHSTRHNV